MNMLLPLLIALVFISCKQHEFTLEELQKAKWDSLSKGVWYIITERQNGNALQGDSIELKLIGFAEKKLNSSELSFESIPPAAEELLKPLVKEKLGDSRSGYLKINFSDILRPETLTGIVYLKGDYFGRWSFSGDSAILVKIPGIHSVTFVSKEDAKKKYMEEDSNNTWEKVLDENPLPNSIEIVLEKKDWTEESMKELSGTIKDCLALGSDVLLPLSSAKKSDRYFFFAYKRK